MRKANHAVKPTKTQGDRHDVSAKEPSAMKPTRLSPPPPRRTDAALKPKAPLEVLISRALDQELEWYFAYGEAALARGSVAILPSYAAVRVIATEPESAVQGKAVELARTVQRCLLSLRALHASILRTAYTPRRWPEPIARAFQSAAPIAVRLALSSDPWPPPTLRVERLRTRAETLLGQGVVAYATARALEGGDLGVA
jgi:hypothetical protein